MTGLSRPFRDSEHCRDFRESELFQIAHHQEFTVAFAQLGQGRLHSVA
jgi:hypothetical protein